MSTESKTAPNLNQMPDNPINLSHQMMLQFGQQMQQMQQMQLQQQLQQQQMERDVSPDDFRSMDLSGYGGANKVRKCILCEFTTVGEEQLIQHEKLEHNKTKFFRCEKCSYVTHIKARFSKHVKYHSMPMIKCSMCDFRTPYKWNLDRHMKNHGGNGAYKCSVCNFTADIKQSLTVHEMNHHVPPLANSLRDGEMSGDEMQLYNMVRTFLDETFVSLLIFTLKF